MKLRELRTEDASLMLEWMDDDFVVHDLATDFSKKTMEDCINFIEYAISQTSDLAVCKNIHMAVTDDNNEYMGTVSLKHINRQHKNAEFAITVRRSAMGRGYSSYAMNEIIRFGFETPELDLASIYWCVDKNNLRARRFYDKQNYQIVQANEYMMENYKRVGRGENELIWYSVHRSSHQHLIQLRR